MKKTEIRKSLTRKTIDQRGIAPIIAVVAVLMASVLVIEGVYVVNFVADVEVVKRTARELAIINAVDTIEFAKKALHQAVSYSFYKASYDVLGKGGFCAFDEGLCREDCKMPYGIPTHKCRPWWRIYDDKYAPDLLNFKAYLSDRTSAIYDDYASLFFGPDYCPQPPGKVTIEDKGEYMVRVDVTNTEGGVIEYKSENLDIVEHTVSFSDTFGASTLDLFEFAKNTFVDNDNIGLSFSTANEGMANTWCKMDGGYCNMTIDCKSNPYNDMCFYGSYPQTNCCWHDNCCCKAMFFGDICEGDVGSSGQSHIRFCESKLPIYCSKGDETSNRNDPCDFNNDDIISASEQYNCTSQEKIEESIHSSDGVLEASTKIDNCIRVGHDAHFSGQRVEFGHERWIEDCGCMPNHWKIDCDGIATPCTQIQTEINCGITENEPQYGCYWNEWCEGIPADCSNFVDEGARCEAHGCSYSEWCDDEGGEPYPCDTYNEDESSCTAHGCSFDPITEECFGTPYSCDSYDSGDDCSDAGCTWHQECSGTPYDCNQYYYDDNYGCSDAGCTWHQECQGTALPCSSWNRAGVSDKPTCSDMRSKCDSQLGCSVVCDRDDNCCDLRPSQGEVDNYGNCLQYGCYCDPHPSGWWATYIDVRCNYNYFGTANATVSVIDTRHNYPIDSSWTGFGTSFHVVSGNAEGCSSGAETNICCPAITTHESDEAAGCKTKS